jgi:hypothetical protein
VLVAGSIPCVMRNARTVSGGTSLREVFMPADQTHAAVRSSTVTGSTVGSRRRISTERAARFGTNGKYHRRPSNAAENLRARGNLRA